MTGPQGNPLLLLSAALDAGRQLPTLSELGGVALLTGDASALLACDDLPELIQVIVDDGEALASTVGQDFLLGAAASPSTPLMLEAVVEVFLSHPAAVAQLGDALVDVWLDTSRAHHDLIGGIALEGSARLVLAAASSPYALLDRLKRLKRELPQFNDDFSGRAVRVAGAVAEHFAAPEVPALLESFLTVDDVADDAAFELGMLALRQALQSNDTNQARSLLLRARERFSDAYADEQRTDAAAFGAAVDAVLSYSAGSPAVAGLSEQLQAAVLEIRLNLLGLPAGWRTPRYDTLAAWQQLIGSLERAQAADDPGSWLHAGRLISDLVSVYSAHRTLQLVTAADDGRPGSLPSVPSLAAPGLHALLAPRIEHTLLAHEGGQAIFDTWLEELQAASYEDTDGTPSVLREQAETLRLALAQERPPPAPKPDSPASAALAGLVGEERAQRIHDRLAPEPELSSHIEAMLEARFAREPIDEIPIIATLYRRVQQQLREQCPQGYVGQFAADIDVLLALLLRFLNLRLSETQKFGGEARKYLRKIKATDEKPLEKELGRDLWDFLCGLGLRVDLEVSNIGAGRVDVAWRPHTEQITIELKRDWADPTWDAVAEKYLAQAVSYQVSGPPVNFFMVLDLTDKPHGLAALPACVEVRTVPGPAGDPRPRTLIMFRIQGNKRDPSSL